jgi:hypothetical protein
MRWYVESFLGGAFELRRHQCAGAAQVVHGLSSERARQLYDLALLECRRVMHGSLPPWPAVEPSRLIGRREAWMLRYLPLMNAAEFSKFFRLLRNLSPYVILIIDPSNRSPRQDRCAKVTRRNIEFVLGGHPDALPLFT